MKDLGRYFTGCTVADMFTTVTTTGAPTALTGSPAPSLTLWRDGVTCSTVGITLALNCSGATGLNAYSVNTVSHPCGHDYIVTIVGGTVGGTCVSGYVVGRFHLRKPEACDTVFSTQSVLNNVPAVTGSVGSISGITFPTNFGATHILAGGEVAIDWGRVANCTTVQNLTCTAIFSATKLTTRPVVDACSTIFSTDRIVDVSNIGTGSAPTAAEVADAVWEEAIADHSGTAGSTAEALDNAGAAGTPPTIGAIACTVWQSLQTDHGGTCGTFGYLLNCRTSDALQPEIPGRRAAITAAGNIGVNWARVEGCTTVQTLTCTRIYSATEILNPQVIDACSTVFSVTSVINNVPGVTADVSIGNCATVYRVETVSQCVVRTLLQSDVITEPSTVYTFPASITDILGYRGMLDTNCITTTAREQSLCNRAASVTVATYPITCTTTIVHRGSAS